MPLRPPTRAAFLFGEDGLGQHAVLTLPRCKRMRCHRIPTSGSSRHLPPGAATRHLKRVIRSKGDRKPESMLRSCAPSPTIRFPHGAPFESCLSLYSILHTQYSRDCTFAQAAGRRPICTFALRTVHGPDPTQTKRRLAAPVHFPVSTCPLAHVSPRGA